MKLSITPKGILILRGTPSKKNEFLVRSSIEIIKINRIQSDYWESEEPVKDGYYIYVETDLESIDDIPADVDADSSETELFTIWNLRNCLLEYEKHIIGDSLSNCKSGSICKNVSSDRQMADFLLITVFVIENLVCSLKYNEAAEIVEKIQGCKGICKETSKTKKCNCC